MADPSVFTAKFPAEKAHSFIQAIRVERTGIHPPIVRARDCSTYPVGQITLPFTLSKTWTTSRVSGSEGERETVRKRGLLWQAVSITGKKKKASALSRSEERRVGKSVEIGGR